MRKIVVFAGTTEGRLLCEYLIGKEYKVEACVASEYGEIVLSEHPLLTIHVGRMDKRQMEAFLVQDEYDLVIDCTHPYAVIVTENVKAACDVCGIKYLRVLRERMDTEDSHVVYFDSIQEVAAYLNCQEGNALITTGSKEVSPYTMVKDYEKRLFLRVLPTAEAMESCRMHGIIGKQIIGMQGPFSKNMNIAMLLEYQAKYLVTKESGGIGGFLEKIEAAKAVGAKVLVIRRPGREVGIPLQEVMDSFGADDVKMRGGEV